MIHISRKSSITSVHLQIHHVFEAAIVHSYIIMAVMGIYIFNKFGKGYTNIYLLFDYSWSCSIDKVKKSGKWPVDDQEHEELLERSQTR